MIAAIYVRVSTEEQAEKGYSLDSQREACRQKALGLGATEVVAFADEGASGALLDRPGLTELRDAVREGGLSLVVVFDPDRLARNLAHQLLVTDEIERAGCRLEFVNFEWQNTAEGRLFYAMRGAIAEYEKEKIKERTARGRKQKAKSGRLPLAFQPYGYRYDAKTGNLAVIEDEARVVADMFRWLVHDGLSGRGVKLRLDAQGIKPPRGPVWHEITVRRILRNPVYAGTMFVNRFECAGVGYNRLVPKDRRVYPKERPEQEWIAVPVPSIIESEEFARAQTLMENARRMWAGRQRSIYTLTGFTECGICGCPMHGEKSHVWNKFTRRYYTCKKPGPKDYCGRLAKADALEEHVWEAVWAEVSDPQRVIDRMETDGGADLEALERELTRLEGVLKQVAKGRASIVATMEKGLLEPQEASAALARIKAQHDEVEAQRRELRHTLDERRAFEIDYEVLDEIAAEMKAAFSPAQRKVVLRKLVPRAVVHEDGRVALYVRLPVSAGAERVVTLLTSAVK